MTNVVFSTLKELSIKYERIDHPPVYTSEQANELVPHRPGATAKNLFLRDKKGKRHILLAIDEKKSVRFKEIEERLGTSRLSLASPSRLEKYLGVEPGAVSMLALINDTQKVVELVVDKSLWEHNQIQAHPLINTMTLIISLKDIEKFLEHTGHEIQFINLE